MDTLYDELPNFSEVLDDVRKTYRAVRVVERSMELRPSCCSASPASARRTSGGAWRTCSQPDSASPPMNSMTAAGYSGASSQWKNASPARCSTPAARDYANPVMVVDEIDKAGTEAQYDPMGALYSLLERETASRFVDEFGRNSVDAPAWCGSPPPRAAHIPEPILTA